MEEALIAFQGQHIFSALTAADFGGNLTLYRIQCHDRPSRKRKSNLFLTIEGNIDKTLAARHNTAQAQKQNLIKWVEHLRLLSWISDSRHKRLKRRGILQSNTFYAQALQN